MKDFQKEYCKQISEIKKESFKFILFYKVYLEILKEYTFLKIDLLEYFLKVLKPLYILSYELLTNLNKYFIIDDNAEDDDYRDYEMINKKCNNITTGVLSVLKISPIKPTTNQKKKNLERYINKYISDLSKNNDNIIQVIKHNVNIFLSSTGLIFKEINKFEKKLKITDMPNIHKLHKNFLEYLNRTSEYFNNGIIDTENTVRSEQSVNNSINQMQNIQNQSQRLKHVNFYSTSNELINSFYKARVAYFERIFDGSDVMNFDFTYIKTNNIKKFKSSLKEMKEPISNIDLYKPSKTGPNGKISLKSTLSKSDFINNLSEFYKMLLIYLSKIYNGDNILLSFLNEPKMVYLFKSRINKSMIIKAREMANEEADNAIEIKKLIPIKLSQLFKEKCVDIMDNNLPCLTQISCGNRVNSLSTSVSKQSTKLSAVSKLMKSSRSSRSHSSNPSSLSKKRRNSTYSGFKEFSDVNLNEVSNMMPIYIKRPRQQDNTHTPISIISETSLGKGSKKKPIKKKKNGKNSKKKGNRTKINRRAKSPCN